MAMTNINDFDTSKKEIESGKESNNTPQKPISQPVAEEMIYRKIATTLGIDSFSEMKNYLGELELIAQYAKNNDVEDLMDFEWFVRQLEGKIGTPPLGEKRITKLARYIYLLNEKSEVEEKIAKEEGLL